MSVVYVRGHCTSPHQISPQAPYVTTSLSASPDPRVAKVEIPPDEEKTIGSFSENFLELF